MSSSPHDSLFKAVFSVPEHACGALRSMMPSNVAEALEWGTLSVVPGSFIDPQLQWRHTDVLFTAGWRGGTHVLLYLLFEHQSSSDPRMAYRLLRYLVRIWERWWSEHPEAEVFPMILPIVLYHGETRWTAPESFEALLDLPMGARSALEPNTVRLSYIVEDLHDVSDDRLWTRADTALAKLVMLCFKHARTSADLMAKLQHWASLVRDVYRAPHGLEALARVMRYVLYVNEHVRRDALYSFLEHQIGSDAKGVIMTVGEQLVQQGIEQGIQQGIEQGIQQGERAILLRQLRKRFGDAVNGDVERRLAMASPVQIEAWSERVLSATQLADVLVD